MVRELDTKSSAARWALALVSALTLAATVSACGGSGETGPTGASEAGPATPAEASHQAVLTTAELPKGSKLATQPLLEDTCSPASYFRGYAEAVVASPGVYLPDAELVQQVGMFGSAAEARKAYAQVTSRRAVKCVRGLMRETSVSFTGGQGVLAARTVKGRVVPTPSRTFGLFLANGFGSAEVMRTAILDRSGLTTLTFISKTPPLSADEWSKICRKAANSLREAVDAVPS